MLLLLLKPPLTTSTTTLDVIAPATQETITYSEDMTSIELPGECCKWSIIKPPSHGSLSFFNPHGGSVYYAPVPKFTGNDEFTFKNGNEIGKVSITVR